MLGLYAITLITISIQMYLGIIQSKNKWIMCVSFTMLTDKNAYINYTMKVRETWTETMWNVDGCNVGNEQYLSGCQK